MRGTPYAPRGHAGRAASRPRPDRGALGVPSEKRKAGPGGRPRERAHAARARRAHGAPRHVSRRAARASSGAQNGASHGAQNGAFSGAQNGASSGAQTARLCGVRRVCFLNRSVWTLVWLLCDLSGWATFALNHTLLPTETQNIVFDAAEGEKDAFILSEWIRRRPLLRCRALPRRYAVCSALLRTACDMSGLWIRLV